MGEYVGVSCDELMPFLISACLVLSLTVYLMTMYTGL